MKLRNALVVLVCLVLVGPISMVSLAKEPVDYVNPFIGTDKFLGRTLWGAYGGTYPGAVVPFGMIQLTPETSRTEPRGYYYSQSRILGFSLVDHRSGYPNGSSGDLFIMPWTGSIESVESGYSASFSHENEQASPGYYRVLLDDLGINVEFAAAPRSAMARFTYPQGQPAYLIIEVKDVRQLDDHTIAGEHRGYNFVMEFAEPVSGMGQLPYGSYVEFGELNGTELLARIGLSRVSHDGARRNISAELPEDWDFDQVRRAARQLWAEELGRIVVEGGTEEDKTIFYTALYHSLLLPHVISDVDGHYRGADGKVYYEPERVHYTAFSPWDTFRTLHPLLTLLMPDRQSDMVHSLLARFEQTGTLLTGPMTGNHAVAIILDSYVKGADDFDPELAYAAMQWALMEPPYGRADIAEYIQYGYVPAELNYSVTKTVEYAYNDWAMLQFAQLLGKTEHVEELSQRALSYRNVFNDSIRLTMPKYADGTWAPDREGYEEGDTWLYSWFAPHNVKDLINLMGGREAFADLLDRCFDEGHYVHDNEPPLHYAYLYTYSGHPWKTQERVRSIMQDSYLNTPGGIRGNDDLGSMSSWYVFGALGIYPFCPGAPEYVLTSPLFSNVTIYLPNGNELVIKAPGATDEKVYIQSVRLNDQELNKPWIEHAALVQGGELVFELSSMPNKLWGSSKDAAPYSFTTGEPIFAVSDLRLSADTVGPNEPFTVLVDVSNASDVPGTCELRIMVNGEYVESRWVLVEADSVSTAALDMRLHAIGEYAVGVNELEPLPIVVEMALPF